MASVVWESAVVGMLRYVIGDDISPFAYTDTKLKNLIIYSSFLLNKDISYGQSYVFDLTRLTITPDPVINNDFAFINLSILKSAFILARNVLRTQATQAVSWKDGQSSLDGRELYKAQKIVLDSAEKEFNEAWMQYQFGDTAPGNSILGPYSSDRISFGTNTGFFGEGVVDYIGRRSNSNYSSQGY